MKIDEVFTIFNKESSTDKFTNNCQSITNELIDKCHFFTIDDNLENYNYTIDEKDQLIKYNMNQTMEISTFEDIETDALRYKNYDYFEREASFQVEIKEEGFFYFFVSY